MELNLKKVTKVAGAACAAAGVVAMSALVASGAALGAMTEGFKSAKSAMERILKEQNPEEVSAENTTDEIEETAETVVETEPEA